MLKRTENMQYFNSFVKKCEKIVKKQEHMLVKHLNEKSHYNLQWLRINFSKIISTPYLQKHP